MITNMEGYKKAYNNAICSNNVYISMNTRKHFRALNMLILGATGSGKSRYYLKPNILQMNTSFVVTDPKGEILDSMGEVLRKNGYNVRVFNISDSGLEKGETDTYNPLKYCTSEAAIRVLVETFMKNMNPGDSKSNDPFWDDSTKMFLSACVGFLTQKPKGSDLPYSLIPEVSGGTCYKPCFANLCELTRMAGNKFKPGGKVKLADGVVIEPDKNAPQKGSELGAIFENIRMYEAKIQGCDPSAIEKPYCLREWENFWGTPEKTATTIMTTTAVKLDPFNIEAVKNMTSDDTVNLDTFGTGRDALFLIIPPADKTYNFLVSLMETQLFKLLYALGDSGCVGSRFLKLKNGELVKFFPATIVEKEDEFKAKVEAIKHSTMVRQGDPSVYKGVHKYENSKGETVKEEVTFTDEWYDIVDADGELVTRRNNEQMAKQYLKDLQDAYVYVPHVPEIPCHVRFLMDEFPNIGEVPEFKEKLATMRGYEISTTVICQSITQLKGMYEKDYEVIDGNCPFVIYLGGDENATCEYISKKMGSSTVKGQNNSVDSKKISDSYNIEERALMKPEEIGRMDYSKQLVLIYGEQPIMDDKYDYCNHKNYKLCRDYAADCGTDAYKFDRKALPGLHPTVIEWEGEVETATAEIKPLDMKSMLAALAVSSVEEGKKRVEEQTIKRFSLESNSVPVGF